MCFNQSQPIRARQPLPWGSTLAYFAPTSFTIKLKDIWKCPLLRISLPYLTKSKCLSLSLNSFQESKVIHGFSSIVTNHQTNTQLILEQVNLISEKFDLYQTFAIGSVDFKNPKVYGYTVCLV